MIDQDAQIAKIAEAVDNLQEKIRAAPIPAQGQAGAFVPYNLADVRIGQMRDRAALIAEIAVAVDDLRDQIKAASAPEVPPKPGPRRTGRNVQINIKATQETVDRLSAIAHQRGWVLGEVLEHALAALEVWTPRPVEDT